jgi:galactokinase
MKSPSISAPQWLAQLDAPSGPVRQALHAVYGADQNGLEDRLRLICEVLRAFTDRFGERPVRLFRSPGRINLRGMHVDTHGGYLNLTTHQREVVVAAAPMADDSVTFANIDAQFDEVSFRVQDGPDLPGFTDEWLSFITGDAVTQQVQSCRGHWSNYIRGSAFSAQHRFRDMPLKGLCAIVGSDIPRGAALSSSAALCTASVLAFLGINGLELHHDALILAARDAEWLTGSRCGVSDQAAMILASRGELVNVALYAARLDTSPAVHIPFPESLDVLVINSFTERSLSGPHIVAYTRNRFAYTLAMMVAAEEMRNLGFANTLETLADLSPGRLGDDGPRAVYELLLRVPEDMSLGDFRARYGHDEATLGRMERAYDSQFGSAPADERPTHFDFRGPLMFGIAESERARRFAGLVAAGDWDEAGLLMVLGHDGDRRVTATGAPYHYDVSDAALRALADAQTPIERCPGAYGASSPALDALVDAALSGGALGASLTGAGIAGTVLALCRAMDTPRVIEKIRSRLASDDYEALAGRNSRLSDGELAQAVLVNAPPAAAGELAWP